MEGMKIQGTMFCPYCNEYVKVKRTKNLRLVITFVTGLILPYLVYALLSSGRVCTRCNNRIYTISSGNE